MSGGATTQDGLVIVNLWESLAGPAAFAQVPEVQEAQRASGLAAPHSFERYQHVQLHARTAGDPSGGCDR